MVAGRRSHFCRRGRWSAHRWSAGSRASSSHLAGERCKGSRGIHLDAPWGATPIRVTLDVGEGEMMEQLPAGLHEGTRYQWDLVARRGSCRAAELYPESASTSCRGRQDGYCEAAELAAYESDDGACLHVDGERWNHLFYRARVRAALPVEVRQDSEGFHLRSAARLPGKLLRIRRGARPADTQVQIFDAPENGAEMRLPDASTSGAADARRQLRAELASLGMTASESAAFLRAWDADLFGSEEPLANGQQGGRAPDELEPKEDALIYFLPESVVQAMAPLTFEPEAREMRRAILVRIDLTPAQDVVEGRVSREARPHLGRPRWRVTGPRDEVLLRRQLRVHDQELLTCYEESLRQNERSTGFAELRYTINGEGTTDDVEVRWRAGGSAALQACLEAAIRTWNFEGPANAETRVRQPLLFERR